MGSTTTSAIELAKIRVPIADCKTFEMPAAHGSDVTIGDFLILGDCLTVALNTSISEIVVCAYDIPRLVVPCRGAAIPVGAALGFIAASTVFAQNDSDLTTVAHAIEEKAGGPSNILVHFDGRAKQSYTETTSALIVSLDVAI